MEYRKATTTGSGKSSPSPASFLCKGNVVEGEFIPSDVYIQSNTLGTQESIRAFLTKHGLTGDQEA